MLVSECMCAWRVFVNECAYTCVVARAVVRNRSCERGIVREVVQVGKGVLQWESNGGILPAGLPAHVGILGRKVQKVGKGARDLDTIAL